MVLWINNKPKICHIRPQICYKKIQQIIINREQYTFSMIQDLYFPVEEV